MGSGGSMKPPLLPELVSSPLIWVAFKATAGSVRVSSASRNGRKRGRRVAQDEVPVLDFSQGSQLLRIMGTPMKGEAGSCKACKNQPWTIQNGDKAGPAAVTMGVLHPATIKIARKISSGRKGERAWAIRGSCRLWAVQVGCELASKAARPRSSPGAALAA